MAKNILDQYLFLEDGKIVSTKGNRYSDFEPLFDHLERFIYDLGANIRWSKGVMSAGHVDLKKFKDTEKGFGISYEIIKYTTNNWADDNAEIQLCLGENIIEKVRTLNDLLSNIAAVVTSPVSDSLYKKGETPSKSVKQAKQTPAFSIDARKPVITRNTDHSFDMYQIVKLNGHVFQLVCQYNEFLSNDDLNQHYVKMFSDNGLSYIVDSKFLNKWGAFKNIVTRVGKDEREKAVTEGIFEPFVEYLKELHI